MTNLCSIPVPSVVINPLDELIADMFAGGGGASTGIELALNRSPDHASNHAEDALGMHRINHPTTVHHCEDVFDVDPVAIAAAHRKPWGFAWFSPDCKHFSKAKGGKPLDKKIRGLATVMFRWAACRTRVMQMENVEEISTWGPLLRAPEHPAGCQCMKPCTRPDPAQRGRTWRAFLDILGPGIRRDHPDLDEFLNILNGKREGRTQRLPEITRAQLIAGFGYQVQHREIRACDHGAPTIRRRLYLIARCDGRPIRWPEPTHFSPGAEPDSFAQNNERPYWRPIAGCIDWFRPCPSIFMNRRQARQYRQRTGIQIKRPIVKATLRRIACGVDRHILKAKRPFFISLTHQGGDRIESAAEPARTVTGANRGEKALAAASVVKLRGDPETHAPGHAADEPAHTSSAGGTHHALGVAYLAQHNAGFNTTPGHDARAPVTSLTAKGSQQQVVTASIAAYYGNDKEGQAVDEAARTVTTKERFGLAQCDAVYPALTVEQLAGARRVAKFLRKHGVQFEGELATVGDYVIVDIGMRMLTPRELFRAQGFPETYIIDRALLVDRHTGEVREQKLNKEQQIRMCGNSVCPDVARALVLANVPELAAPRGNPNPSPSAPPRLCGSAPAAAT